MVAHQHIGVQPATEPPQCLPQALQVALAVKVIQKTRQPVVLEMAALECVLRFEVAVERQSLNFLPTKEEVKHLGVLSSKR
jgi:hypothetical protein